MAELDKTRQHTHGEHIARVHALCSEVQTSILALEKNNVTLLEQSLAKQEALCNQIAILKAKSAEGKPIDARSAAEIRHAYMALAQKNRTYASLLKRSSRTVNLLAGFYRCYGASIENKSLDHTWSCEV
jgi:hypothetical protein